MKTVTFSAVDVAALATRMLQLADEREGDATSLRALIRQVGKGLLEPLVPLLNRDEAREALKMTGQSDAAIEYLLTQMEEWRATPWPS